jgi:hypothetical protein
LSEDGIIDGNCSIKIAVIQCLCSGLKARILGGALRWSTLRTLIIRSLNSCVTQPDELALNGRDHGSSPLLKCLQRLTALEISEWAAVGKRNNSGKPGNAEHLG